MLLNPWLPRIVSVLSTWWGFSRWFEMLMLTMLRLASLRKDVLLLLFRRPVLVQHLLDEIWGQCCLVLSCIHSWRWTWFLPPRYYLTYLSHCFNNRLLYSFVLQIDHDRAAPTSWRSSSFHSIRCSGVIIDCTRLLWIGDNIITILVSDLGGRGRRWQTDHSIFATT